MVLKLKGMELTSAVAVEDPAEIAELLKSRDLRKTKSGADMVVKATTLGGLTTRARASDGRPSYKSGDYSRLAQERDIPWDDAYTDRVVGYWGSDERGDHDGDVTLQSWDFSVFKANPVMPWSHGWDDFPIGTVLDWQVVERKSEDYQGPALWLVGMFAKSEDYDVADRALRLTKAGILRGGSAGFTSRKAWKVTNPEERKKIGVGEKGFVLDDNLLLEYSPCTIPTNSGAVAVLNMAKARKQLQADDMNWMREIARFRHASHERGGDAWLEEDKTLLAMAKMLFPQHRFKAHKDLDEPIDSAVDMGRVYATCAGERDPEPSVTDRLKALEDLVLGISKRLDDVEEGQPSSESDEDYDFEGLGRQLEDVNNQLKTLTTRGTRKRKETKKR